MAVRGHDGRELTVVSVAADPGVKRVYNLTVESDHVYYVGELGSLAHNNNCDAAIGAAGADDAEGIVLKVGFEEGMEASAFERKVGQLRNAISDGRAISNLPHGVSDAARRGATRAYRQRLIARIRSFYRSNRASMDNALKRLRNSDIDHILDLQLGGQNVATNLQALHSFTNQRLGSQIAAQLPVGQQVPIIGIEVMR